MLRRDSSKEELPIPRPDKERDKDFGPRLRLPSAPTAIGEYADCSGLVTWRGQASGALDPHALLVCPRFCLWIPIYIWSPWNLGFNPCSLH